MFMDLPYEYLTEKHIRRYGFHGISHRYVSERFAELNGRKPADYRLITCHLGNGCSVCAIDRGISIDTSMGFTPPRSLINGYAQRGCGRRWQSWHLVTQQGVDPKQLAHLLNSSSGLQGLSGVSNDMRDLLREVDRRVTRRAKLAVDAFCYPREEVYRRISRGQ